MFEKWLCHDPTHQIGMRNALSDVRPHFFIGGRQTQRIAIHPAIAGLVRPQYGTGGVFFIFSFPLTCILVQKLRYGLSPNIVFYMHHDTKAIDIQNAREKG